MKKFLAAALLFLPLLVNAQMVGDGLSKLRFSATWYDSTLGKSKSGTAFFNTGFSATVVDNVVQIEADTSSGGLQYIHASGAPQLTDSARVGGTSGQVSVTQSGSAITVGLSLSGTQSLGASTRFRSGSGHTGYLSSLLGDDVTTQDWFSWGAGGGDLYAAVTIGSAYIYRAGGTDVPVTDGGTGASDASGARANLSLQNVTNESKATMFTSPTFTGTVTIPSPFTLGGTSVTISGAQMNYLSSAASPVHDGVLTATRIPYATDANTLADNGNFIWDNTNNVLKISENTSAWQTPLAIYGASYGISFEANWPAIALNAYHNGTAWKAISTGYAGVMPLMNMSTGSMEFLIAPSTTADATPSWIVPLVIDQGGDVSIGTGGTTTSKLLVQQVDNGVALTLKINATSANVTTADKFIEFHSSAGVIADVTGTASSGVIIYNTFTGAHYAQTSDKMEMGMIVSATGQHMENRDDGKAAHLPTVRLTSKRADKAVYGVYSESVDKVFAFGDTTKPMSSILALGTGVILVTSTGGNIEVGDYIQSSPIKGLGERQPDGVQYNYTVAKSTMAVDWSKEPRRKDGKPINKLIPCVYVQ